MDKSLMISRLQAAYTYFKKSTAALDEPDADFAPAEGSLTTVQQMAHVAQTVEWFCKGAFSPDGMDTNWEGAWREVQRVSSVAEARAWVDRAFEAAMQLIEAKSDAEWAAPIAGEIMAGSPRAAIVGGIIEHTAHHRGALTVYTRLRGKVPPMPYA